MQDHYQHDLYETQGVQQLQDFLARIPPRSRTQSPSY